MLVSLLSGHVFSLCGGQRSKVKVTAIKNALSTGKPHLASVRMVCPRCMWLLLHASGRAHFVAGEGWHRRWRAPRLGTGGRRRWLRPHGGICILQACWRICCTFVFFFTMHTTVLLHQKFRSDYWKQIFVFTVYRKAMKRANFLVVVILNWHFGTSDWLSRSWRQVLPMRATESMICWDCRSLCWVSWRTLRQSPVLNRNFTIFSRHFSTSTRSLVCP